MTVKFDGVPGAFTVAELAQRDNVSRREVLRRLRNGVYAGYASVGNVILVLNQAAADEWCRSLPPGDERRQVVDEIDEIVLADHFAARKEQEREAADRAKRMSPKEVAKRQREVDQQREAETPRRSKITVLTQALRGRTPVSNVADIELVADDRLIAAAPRTGLGEGSKKAYTVNPANHAIPDGATVYTPERND